MNTRHTSSRICTRAALVLGTIALLATTGTASADDGKIYPASMCQSRTASDENSLSYPGNGRVCNTSTTKTVYLNCPVVRDTINGHIEFWRVYAKNGNPSKKITCILRSLKPATDDGWGWYVKRTIGLAPDNDPDAWQAPYFNGSMSSAPYGPYEMRCALPPAQQWTTGLKQACVGAYRVDEN